MILLAILFVVFLITTFFLGLPVAISVGLSTVVGMMYSGISLVAMPQRMFASLDSFTFLAIPFFILAGKLMEYGGISRRLVRLFDLLLSRIKGGLAITTVVACAFFAALSGSAPGTVAAIGSIMYPEMVEKGYDEEFSAGIITVAGSLGPIIPPSIIMVIFGVTVNVSIGDMFLGGIIIGLLITIFLIISVIYISAKKGYGGAKQKLTFSEKMKTFMSALPALGMPVIVLGGIYGGFFTPTEAAAASVAYVLVIGLFVYKELKIKDLPKCFFDAAISTAVIMIIIANSVPFSWVFAREGLATMILAGALETFKTPYAFFIFSYILVVIFGTFMEGSAICMLLMPILFPISQSLGIHPIHYGVVMCVAITIGMCSPPVATSLYAAAGVTKLPVTKIVKGMLPFFVGMILLTFITIFTPQVYTAFI